MGAQHFENIQKDIRAALEQHSCEPNELTEWVYQTGTDGKEWRYHRHEAQFELEKGRVELRHYEEKPADGWPSVKPKRVKRAYARGQ